MGYSYRELEFALLDSASMQRFARVDPFQVPKKSALQSAISAIDADAWRAINGVLLRDAKEQRIESGEQVRIDSTVTETHILEPRDSRLLYDGVRVLTRLLRQAQRRLPQVRLRDHRRAAKRRMMEVGSQRGAQRRAATYRKLLRVVKRTISYVEAALPVVACEAAPWAETDGRLSRLRYKDLAIGKRGGHVRVASKEVGCGRSFRALSPSHPEIAKNKDCVMVY